MSTIRRFLNCFTKYRVTCAIFLFALLMTGCSAVLQEADWCYQYDFRNSNYGFSLTYGSWVAGRGFRTDTSGRLSLTYAHSSSVTPTAAIITAERVSSTQFPTKVIVKADIYGLHFEPLQTEVPANINSSDFYLLGNGSSDKLQITGEAIHAIYLVRLQVRGDGANPFPSSNCSTAATTPQPGTGADGGLDIGSLIDVPVPGVIGDALQQADSELSGVTQPLRNANGSSLLPALTGGTQIFGYIKWIISGAAAQELAGPFAPIVSHMGVYLVMNFALTGVYLVVYASIYIIRWAIWLYNKVLQLVTLIATLLSSVPGLIIIAILIGIALALVLMRDDIVRFLQTMQDGVCGLPLVVCTTPTPGP